MERLALVVMVVVAVVMTGVDCGRRRRMRACRRAAGNSVAEQGAGARYLWSNSGLSQVDLPTTFHEGAFVPADTDTVFKYPMSIGHSLMGLTPAKIFYDFSSPGEPVAVIRQGRRGRGPCIVIPSDVGSRQAVIDTLSRRNMSQYEAPDEEDSILYEASLVADPSSLPANVRNLCSQDQCGMRLEPVFYSVQESTIDAEYEVGTDVDCDDDPEFCSGDEEEDDDDLAPRGRMEFQPSFLLLNSRITITGLTHPKIMRRQQGRGHRGRGHGARGQGRGQGRGHGARGQGRGQRRGQGQMGQGRAQRRQNRQHRRRNMQRGENNMNVVA